MGPPHRGQVSWCGLGIAQFYVQRSGSHKAAPPLTCGATGETLSAMPAKQRRGSQHHNAKLREADVEQLLRLRAAGHTYRQLAARYGVSVANIGWILRGHHWKHVPRLAITLATPLRGPAPARRRRR